MMLEVPFKIASSDSASHINPYICFTAPIAKGKLFTSQNLVIQKTKKELLKADFEVLARWPDQSIKWLKCEFYNSKSRATNFTLTELGDQQQATSIPQKIDVINDAQLTIKTELHSFTLNKKRFAIDSLSCALSLKNQEQTLLTEQVDDIKFETSDDFVSKTIQYRGAFQDTEQTKLAKYDANLTFFSALPVIKLDITLRNPKAMVHHGGKWDLGNENSLLFQHFNITFSCNNNEASLKLANEETHQSSLFSLYQASSGGENWQSDNHVNAQNKVVLPFNGYQLLNNGKEIKKGDRASPTVTFETTDKTCLSAYIEQFWQNFPKAIDKTSEQLVLALFPEQHVEPHELMPGEQKTHTVWLSLDKEHDAKAYSEQTNVILSSEYLAQTKALPYFTQAIEKDDIDALIAYGLEHENNFFAKREQIDEYGWRNFGDLYADHETLEYQGKDELISHYNNQYDPLYGFLRQYLNSQDVKWLTLAKDLSRHTKDIDIYHTNDDKPEYNHGLFWHTDHYLPAKTAAHRTYSKYQQANAYQDHAGGGGPGGQHCYTTGLMLHYFLTGEASSKEAVIKLANWISNVYEGGSTFFDKLLGVKNSQYPGYKNVVTGQYPLDRGTGNYIIALIDAFEVSNQQSYLDKASLIIKNTVSPSENLNLRNLDNVEETWFYTVFLQAVYRYLATKENIEQIDESYTYARESLLTYSRWMAENEAPYLTKPEILEYPNHTWAAQDIRKANVLYYASLFAINEQEEQAFIKKADEIYQYVAKSLSEEKTHYFTRILCILMQNHGIKNFVQVKKSEQNTDRQHIATVASKPEFNSNLASEMPAMSKGKAIKVLIRSLLSCSPREEINWLRKRVKKVDNILSKFEG